MEGSSVPYGKVASAIHHDELGLMFEMGFQRGIQCQHTM